MSEPTELWLPHPRYVGYYEVSDHGQVRSLTRTITRRDGVVQRYRGQVLQPITVNDGYQVVGPSINGTQPLQYVHILVLETFDGPCPPGMECRHWDGNPGNNHRANLLWGTHSDNIHDIVRHGNHHMANRWRCPRQHLLVAPNLRACDARKGRRCCLACDRAHSAEQKARKRGRPFDFQTVSDDRYRAIMLLEQHGD